MRSINRCKEHIDLMKIKIQQNKNTCETRNSQLSQEKDMLLKHFRELKKKMLNFRDDEGRRLADLTANSKECMDTLTGFMKMGEKILKTAELCRKLETE